MRFIGACLLAVVSAATLITCGGSNSDRACAPGTSIACIGPAGCMSNQVCTSDGRGFGPCNCSSGGPDASGDGSNNGMDSSSGTDGADSSSDAPFNWDPKMLPGLALWLDPDIGVVMDPMHTSAVLKWKDQSGNANDVVIVNGAQAYFEIDPQALGTHNAIHCPGNGTWLEAADSSSLQWGTGDFSVAMVVKIDNQTGTIFYSKDAQQGGYFSLFSSAGNLNFQVGTGKTLVVPQNFTKFHIVIAKAQKPLQLAIDALGGTGPSTSVDVTNATAGVHLCQGGSQTGPEMAELIAAKGTLSANDEANLSTYFKKKFGL